MMYTGIFIFGTCTELVVESCDGFAEAKLDSSTGGRLASPLFAIQGAVLTAWCCCL
jgi:hypothetical protein